MAGKAFAYVTNTDSDNISVVDLETFKEVSKIKVGGSPRGSVRFDSLKKFGYVSNTAGNTVSVIDLHQNTEVDKITVGLAPRGLMISEDDKYLFASNSGANTVSVIDLKTRQQTQELPVGENPRHMARLIGQNAFLVSVWGDDKLAKISIDASVIAHQPMTVSMGENARPYSLAVNKTGKTAYVANTQADYVSIVDLANDSETNRITVGFGGRAIVLSGDEKYAFVSVECPNQVVVIDLSKNEVVKKVDVGPSPRGIALDIENNMLYGGTFGRSTALVGSRNSLYAIDVSDPPNAKYVGDTPVGLGPCSVSVLKN